MRTSIKLCLAGLAAALVFASSAGTASAGKLSMSNRNIRATWRELTYEAKPEQEVGQGQIRCAVTMEGSFHSSTIAKVNGDLIGYMTRAIVKHPCAGNGDYFFHNGIEMVLGLPATSLPWHMRYSSFAGTLPNITSITVNLLGIRMTVDYPGGIFPCLDIYGSATEARRWIFNVGAGGGITSFQPTVTPEHLIRRQGTEPFCPELGKLSGASQPVTLLGNVTVVSLRLI